MVNFFQSPDFNPQAGGSFDPTQEAKIRQQRALAERLQAIGAPQGTQMVSGGKYQFAVPQSSLSHLAKGLSAGIGSYQSGKADQQEQDVIKSRQDLMAQALERFGNNDMRAGAGVLMQDPAMMDKGFDIYMDDVKAQRERELMAQILGGASSSAQQSPRSGSLAADLAQASIVTGNPSLMKYAEFERAREESSPEYIADKKAAEKQGVFRAETQESYESAKSKLPSLMANVAKLNELAQNATYTNTGQAVDWLGRQLGVATEGAVARTDFISTIDNQVLPLLRDTFGPAFTKAEGDNLKTSLADPDKTPQEKQASLQAFIDQKVSNINADAAKLGLEPLSYDASNVFGEDILNDPDLLNMGITPEMIERVRREEGL